MVQEMVEVVLDEAPDAQFQSPDERRLRQGRGGGGARRRGGSGDDGEGDDGCEGSGRPREEPPPPPQVQPYVEPVVDTLFTKRRAAAEEAPREDAGSIGGARREPCSTAEGDGMVGSLFCRRARPSETTLPGPDGAIVFGCRDPEQAGFEESGGDESDIDGEDVPRHGRAAWWALPCHSTCCPRVASLFSAVVACACSWRGLALFTSAMLLAAVTAGLATACEPGAPLAEFCIVEGAVQWTLAAMPASVLLCGSACWLRHRLAKRKRKMSESWKHDGEAQSSACDVLVALTAAPAEERVKYVRQVVQIMKDFPDKSTIQHKGCVALESICRAQRGNVAQVQAAGAVPVLLAALQGHLRVRKVQSAGLGALACLAKVSRQQIFDQGGIPIVLRSMAKFRKDHAVQVSGAMALGALCLSSQTNRKSVAKYGGIPLLFLALERHMDRADVAVSTSEALSLIAQGGPALQKQMNSYVQVLRAVVVRYDSAVAATGGENGGGGGAAVALRSLRKLEGQLADAVRAREDDECSEASATSAQELAKVHQASAGMAFDLQERLDKWCSRAKA